MIVTLPPLRFYGLAEHTRGANERQCETLLPLQPLPVRTGRAIRTVAVAAAVVALAGCGGASVEDKVADRYDQDVSGCWAVTIVDEGKIYSCQADGTTLCVIVDGDDVFDATGRAEQVGVSC